MRFWCWEHSRNGELSRLYFMIWRIGERMDGGWVCVRALARKFQCAVERRRLLASANPARQLSLQPVSIGADDRGINIV